MVVIVDVIVHILVDGGGGEGWSVDNTSASEEKNFPIGITLNIYRQILFIVICFVFFFRFSGGVPHHFLFVATIKESHEKQNEQFMVTQSTNG